VVQDHKRNEKELKNHEEEEEEEEEGRRWIDELWKVSKLLSYVIFYVKACLFQNFLFVVDQC